MTDWIAGFIPYADLSRPTPVFDELAAGQAALSVRSESNGLLPRRLASRFGCPGRWYDQISQVFNGFMPGRECSVRFLPVSQYLALFLALGLAVPPAWAQENPPGPSARPPLEKEVDDEECVYADIQAEDVDLDKPQEYLGERVDLDIPPDAVIGQVVHDRRDIFDLSETGDHWFYTWGNRLHIITKEAPVRAQLLFETGEPYSQEDLEETERALRRQDYLLDAWVQPYRLCGKRVDVVVVTRDLWTLRPELGYSRSGGETETAFGITDDNFLGLGKQLEVKRETGPERDTTIMQYGDPNIWGSRWQGALLLAESSDGEEQAMRVERPFYEFGTTWATGFDARHNDLIQDLYFRGDEVNSFRHDHETFGAFGGYSLGIEDQTDTRLLFGYRYMDDEFAVAPQDLPPPDPFPQDRTLSYPWIGLQIVENRFVETLNLTRIQRIEDIRAGIEFDVRLGWSDESFGGDQDRLVLEGRFRNAVVAFPGHLIDYSLSQRGWYNNDTDELENFEVEYGMRYFKGGVEQKTSWFAELELAAAENFTSDRQFYIGGSSGLRGYPFRYQRGDRRVRFTVERRYYSDWHPWDLFRVGGVAFFDVGRAWYSGRDNGPNGGWLKDIGVGLRVASDRFETGKILHVDLAFPLDGGDDIDDIQLLLRGRSTF